MIEVTLSVQKNNGALEASLTFTNQGEARVDLVKFITLPDGDATNNFFEILYQGKPLPYQGKMKERAAPGPEGFYWLAPKELVVGHLRLNDFYPIPSGGTLQIQYQSFNHFAVHAQLLNSNMVEIRT